MHAIRTVHSDSSHQLQPIKNLSCPEQSQGRKVAFDADKEYTIGTALDLTFLRNIELGKLFKRTFQNMTTLFQLGGENVNVHGGGTLDGNG
ncbi:hypothetical protein EYZ11_003433 [Aspergillus tanneri]|uniref:Uncharacterized protein n=1 Tax=Aspergillus tanneri TaxID=1220188 RepID=A0A4S3JNJ8_9EURO|nr:hypothetical protein EYZ11_003433 [Aspergillus tanneri]